MADSSSLCKEIISSKLASGFSGVITSPASVVYSVVFITCDAGVSPF